MRGRAQIANQKDEEKVRDRERASDHDQAGSSNSGLQSNSQGHASARAGMKQACFLTLRQECLSYMIGSSLVMFRPGFRTAKDGAIVTKKV